MLSLGFHEGVDDVEIRFLLDLELLGHRDIPVPNGLTGQLAYKALDSGGVVKNLQLAHIIQVAVDSCPALVKLLELGGFCDGALAVLEVVEMSYLFRRQLAILPYSSSKNSQISSIVDILVTSCLTSLGMQSRMSRLSWADSKLPLTLSSQSFLKVG